VIGVLAIVALRGGAPSGQGASGAMPQAVSSIHHQQAKAAKIEYLLRFCGIMRISRVFMPCFALANDTSD
jgi:hypothetical protein